MAGELLMNISTNENERARYRSRKKYEMDLRSNLATARDEGVFNSRVESIRNIMDSFNIPLDQAMAALKIPEIERPRYKEMFQPQ